MRLNIETSDERNLLISLRAIFDGSVVEIEEVYPTTVTFKIYRKDEPLNVYPADSLIELSKFWGIPLYKIRIL